nr:gamma-glutamyl-gamma-aminobutyrate hydrolase family protein [Phytoactinopolyspora mesophila]
MTTYLEQAQCQVWDTEFALLPSTYVTAVAAAGGVPVLLPPAGAGAAEIVQSLDGLVISGGADIDPYLYGERPHPKTTGSRPVRDAWEVRLLNLALDRGLPVLGVCRGMQLLNVALGGSLTQHLPETVGHDAHRPDPGVFGTTPVQIREGSRVGRILGGRCAVPCYHHQALGRVATSLEAVGWAEDGTVEAVELPGPAFVVGVQWHPEQDSSDIRLFQALVDAAEAAAAPAASDDTPTTSRAPVQHAAEG